MTAATFVKQRAHPPAGSIPQLLDMFGREVRFYREVAPEVGVRVPAVHAAVEEADGYRLELEDLGHWTPGGDPVAVARTLRVLHERWQDGEAERRWPWLRRSTEAAPVIGALYDRTWPGLAERHDLTPAVHDAGARLIGRVAELERTEADTGPLTLIHGDAALRNVRTSPTGEVALVDWEDVRLAPAAADVVWLLVSSVDPDRWDAVLAAAGLDLGTVGHDVVDTALAQGLLSLADTPAGSLDAEAAVRRLDALAR